MWDLGDQSARSEHWRIWEGKGEGASLWQDLQGCGEHEALRKVGAQASLARQDQVQTARSEVLEAGDAESTTSSLRPAKRATLLQTARSEGCILLGGL